TGWYLSGELRTLWGAFSKQTAVADRALPRQATSSWSHRRRLRWRRRLRSFQRLQQPRAGRAAGVLVAPASRLHLPATPRADAREEPAQALAGPLGVRRRCRRRTDQQRCRARTARRRHLPQALTRKQLPRRRAHDRTTALRRPDVQAATPLALRLPRRRPHRQGPRRSRPVTMRASMLPAGLQAGRRLVAGST